MAVSSNNKTFLITRPSYDLITNYFMYWSAKLVTQAEQKNMAVVDIREKKVVQKEVVGRLKKVKPDLVVLNGHGNQFEIVGHDHTPLIDISTVSNLEGAIVYARACDSGHTLGRVAVALGARAYIGYEVPFYMVYDLEKITHPLDDKIAKQFLEPSNQVVISLMKGRSVEEASKHSKEISNKTLQKLVSSEATPEERFRAKFIWSNMEYQVFHGDGSATV